MKGQTGVVFAHYSRFDAPSLRESVFESLLESADLLFSSSAVICTSNLHIHDLFTFVSVLCVFAAYFMCVLCTISHLSLNCLCHSKTLRFITACSSEVIFIRANVSQAFFTKLHIKFHVILMFHIPLIILI